VLSLTTKNFKKTWNTAGENLYPVATMLSFVLSHRSSYTCSYNLLSL